MLDYIKSALVGERPEIWLKKPQLEFETVLTSEDAVKEYNATFGEMKICVKPNGYVEIAGSIHKHYTGGSNATDFNKAAVALSLGELGEALQFDISAARLLNLEYGINQPLPVSAKVLLHRAVLHGNKDFTSRRTFGGKGYQIEAEQQRSTLKLYDKAAQMRIIEHLLRAEIRVTKMQHLDGLKLTTLADLARPGSLAPLGGLLVKAWDNILFYDPAIELNELPKSRRDLLMHGRNPTYWLNLKPDNFRKQRAQFRAWDTQYSDNPLPANVRGEMAATWARLIANEA